MYMDRVTVTVIVTMIVIVIVIDIECWCVSTKCNFKPEHWKLEPRSYTKQGLFCYH